MNPTVLFVKNKKQLLEVEICKLSSLEGFDKLILFLEKYYSARIEKTFEGLGVRKFILETNGIRYQLIYDDFFGNTLCSLSVDSEALVRKIGEDLESRLKNV